jgi:hypothetical protein
MTVVTVTAVARSKDWNPNVGPWLRAQRGARKQDAVIADLAKRGVEIGRSWLSRAENGAPMSDELLAAFQDYYGSVPPPPPTTASPTVDASGLAALIVEAIDRQTAVLTKIIERLPPPPDELDQIADREIARAEQRLAAEKRPTPLRPQRRARKRRVSDQQ